MQAGPGRVVAAMASSAVPLRPDGLALLMHERDIEDALRAYVGDIGHSILMSMHSIHGSDAQLPSYSDVEKELRGKKPRRATLSNEQVISKVDDMINMFLPKGG